MGLSAKLYIFTVISVGTAALANGIYHWSAPDLTYFLWFILFAVPASCLKVPLPGVKFGTMSGLFVFLMAGLVRLTLPELLLTGVVCVAVQSLWHSRFGARPLQVVFSMATVSLAITAADFVYGAVPFPPGPFRLVLAVCAFFPVNTMPIAAVIGLTEGKSIRQVWISSYLWCFPYYVAATSLVSTFIFSDRLLDWQTAFMIIPVVYAVYRSYQFYLTRINAERERAETEHRYATEVKLLHEQALEAKAHLDAVFRASPLALFTVDACCRVTGWNAASEQIFGWKTEEVAGKPLPFATGRASETVRDIIARTLNGEAIEGLESEQCRKDGSTFDGAIWSATLAGFETGPGVLITVADVSIRKRLEEQLRLSHKMEAVGRLAGGIAHDFNNLLTVINGYGSLLAPAVQAHPVAAGYVEQIVGAGNRAAELVAQLLTFSRRQMINPRPLDVNSLARAAERMLERVIGEHIELRIDIGQEPVYIYADSNQMEGALLNLATNARDAMREGGILTISTSVVTVSAGHPLQNLELLPGSWVRISVRDTGCGMNAETKQRLFEPFYTTKERSKGTGLGLASVLGAVEQNGGHIFVTSELGTGSEFSIYLPRIKPAESEACLPETGKHEALRGTETILLVEDEATVRRLLCEALSGSGFSVREARNGADAIDRWGPEIEDIDLLVTDLVMPGMNGLRLIEEIRKLRPRMPVLCMTGYSQEIIGHEDQLPANLEVLQKPLLPQLVVLKARELLDQSCAMGT